MATYDNAVGKVVLNMRNHAASTPALHHLLEELEPEWEQFAMSLRDEGLLVSDEQSDASDNFLDGKIPAGTRVRVNNTYPRGVGEVDVAEQGRLARGRVGTVILDAVLPGMVDVRLDDSADWGCFWNSELDIIPSDTEYNVSSAMQQLGVGERDSELDFELEHEIGEALDEMHKGDQ